MNRFEMLSDFRGEYLVLDVEGLNVDDGCYTWYMSVKDKVADRMFTLRKFHLINSVIF